MTTPKEQEQAMLYPPDNDDVWENRSLFDEASIKSWEPYGKATKSITSDCTETTSKTLSSRSDSTSAGSSADDSSSPTRNSLGMFLDNNDGRNNNVIDDHDGGDDDDDDDEMFTPIFHESAHARSKRRESIKDFGMPSCCSAFDCDDVFGEVSSDVLSNEISPATSTEAMAGAPSEPVGSPRSVIPSMHDDDPFGTDPFQIMKKKMPSPGPKRLSKTRRVDWTGLVAEDPYDLPSQGSQPNNEIDQEGSTSCIAAADGTDLKASKVPVCNENSISDHDHASVEIKPVRESRSSLPAWKILQRERNRRSFPDNRTSLSHSSCHVQLSTTATTTTSAPPKANNSLELKPCSSHVRRTRSLVVINEEDWSDDAPLSCPSKPKKSAKNSIWPEWGSSSDPALALPPPAFLALSDWFPSTPKSPVNKTTKKVRLVPKSSSQQSAEQQQEDVDMDGFPNSFGPLHDSAPSTTKSSSCVGGGKTPACQKRMHWRNRDESYLDSKAKDDETTQQQQSSSEEESSNVKTAAFPPSFFTLRKLDTQTALATTLSWAREKTNNFSDYTITVVVDEPSPDDEGKDIDGGKKFERMTRQSSSLLLQKETYHVHKCVVGIGCRGSGLILEKLRQRRSGGITMIVKLHPICSDAFPLMLDYMYDFKNPGVLQQRIPLTPETAGALRFLSNYFVIPSLFDEVNTYIQNDIISSDDNVQRYHAVATKLKDDELAEATLNKTKG